MVRGQPNGAALIECSQWVVYSSLITNHERYGVPIASPDYEPARIPWC